MIHTSTLWDRKGFVVRSLDASIALMRWLESVLIEFTTQSGESLEVVDWMKPVGASYKVQRRVAGFNDVRLDGMIDLLARAKGRSVFDIGCNIGGVGFSFYENNAAVVHGCDIFDEGIAAARLWFAQLRDVESRFEVVDLAKGPAAVRDAFRGSDITQYDFVLCLATYHKLKRLMNPEDLSALMKYFGACTRKYFAWRATSQQHEDNEKEMLQLDSDLGAAGLKRVHTSFLSSELGACAVWTRA